MAAIFVALCATWTTTGIIAGVNEYKANVLKKSVLSPGSCYNSGEEFLHAKSP